VIAHCEQDRTRDLRRVPTGAVGTDLEGDPRSDVLAIAVGAEYLVTSRALGIFVD
jgi:hypothetical protein